MISSLLNTFVLNLIELFSIKGFGFNYIFYVFEKKKFFFFTNVSLFNYLYIIAMVFCLFILKIHYIYFVLLFIFFFFLVFFLFLIFFFFIYLKIF